MSNETFELVFNKLGDYLKTTPQPNKKEIKNYYKSKDYISHNNENKRLIELIYNLIRYINTQRKIWLINKMRPEGNNLLDVGCGTGYFLKNCKKKNWEVVGVEPNKLARKIAGTHNIKVYKKLESLSGSEKKFDVITLWHVLEHLYDLEDTIKLFQKLLKPSGLLLIAVPNYKSYDAKYYGSAWAAYDVPRHLWHFSRKAVKKLIEPHKFYLIKTIPIKWDAYYIALLSEKNKKGYTNLINAFRVGLKSNWLAKKTKEYSSNIFVFKKD